MSNNHLSKDKQIAVTAALAEGFEYPVDRENDRDSPGHDHALGRSRRSRLCASVR
jgi:hypothetical protein